MIPGARAGNLYKIACGNRSFIQQEIEYYKKMQGGRLDVGHCAAVTANHLFQLTTKEWNSQKGSECFAAVLACMVFHKMG